MKRMQRGKRERVSIGGEFNFTERKLFRSTRLETTLSQPTKATLIRLAPFARLMGDVRPWTKESSDMNERIVSDPAIHCGKPCVQGTRIPVENILEMVREGIGFAGIVRNYYPQITVDDIWACLQYAIDVVRPEDIHVTDRASREFAYTEMST